MAISEERKIKLESMQVKGIRCLLRENVDEESLELRLLQTIGQSSIRDIGNCLNSLSRNNLIRVVEQSPEITDLMIDSAYERYRYGLKPGFTLFWAKRYSNVNLSKDELEARIKEHIKGVHYQENAKYKGLEFVSIISFDDIYEVTFSYLQRFDYVAPTGEFSSIYMMKECFVWIGISKHFIAINNMPDVLVSSLKRLFSKIYCADITNIKVTKGLLNKVFSEDKAKRVTRHSPNPPENQLEKISYADPNLSEKQDCIPTGYENYDVTNTQYSEEIDGDTVGTLGVNCSKGKFYLSKSLTSTQFRTWSIRRITDIIDYFGSRYIGHPNNKLPGIEMNSGSLGHGLPVCVGMALAGKMDKRDYRVYTVMGDGELAEGSVWEAAMSATQYHLDNLCAVVDRNRLQISGSTEDVMHQDSQEERWSAFGWNVITVPGHDYEALAEAFAAARACKGKPTVLIAETIKGFGSAVMENKAGWHHHVPTQEEYNQIMADFASRKEIALHE